MLRRETAVILTCLVFVPALCLVLATVVLPRILVDQDDFVVAAGRGDLDTVQRCIRRGFDVNAKGRGKLDYAPAIRTGKRRGVFARLRDNPFSDDSREIVETPLHAAVRGGRKDVAQLLLDNSANVNEPNEKGETPLHVAAKYNREAFAALLLDNGANVDQCNQKGETPLHIAVKNNRDEPPSVKSIGFPTTLDDPKAAMDAAMERYEIAKERYDRMQPSVVSDEERTALVKLLLAHSPALDAADCDGRTPLHAAAEAGYTKVTEILLDAGADVNFTARCDISEGYALCGYPPTRVSQGPTLESGLTPLHLAARQSHLAAVRLLLSRGADPNGTTETGWTPLHLAVRACDGALSTPPNSSKDAVVELLISRGADVNVRDPRGLTPLLRATGEWKWPVAGLLVEKGADVRASLPRDAPVAERHGAGATALHCAAYHGNMDMVERLLAAGADVNAGAGDPVGTPLLHTVSAYQWDPIIADFLIEHGADVNAADEDGHTPLLSAASAGKHEVVEFLIERDADVNIADEDGHTPLLAAAGRYDAWGREAWARVELLIAHGADVCVQETSGRTVLHYAVKSPPFETVERLLGLGVDINAGDGKPSGTALHALAVQYSCDWRGHIETEQLLRHTTFLLDSGAKVDARDARGQTPMHNAARAGNMRVMELLLGNGADINDRDNLGIVPLQCVGNHGVCSYGYDNVETFKFMVARGADMRLASHNQITSLHLAARASLRDRLAARTRSGRERPGCV
ncbi:MAG TPA: hypothetical protein HPP83_07275 [Candidatus Hydrogenedentes bacterium]|nr:hypothetical protein [Candidatus Hydrogenedentota bacterium]